MARCRDSERLHIEKSDGQRRITDRFGVVQHQWFYRDCNSLIGPITTWNMRMALRAGDIKPDTLVCRDDCEEWGRAWDCLELFDDEDREAYRVNQVSEHHESSWYPDHLHA